jgi:hypothetical protein
MIINKAIHMIYPLVSEIGRNTRSAVTDFSQKQNDYGTIIRLKSSFSVFGCIPEWSSLEVS